jgi:hypothetical protein
MKNLFGYLILLLVFSGLILAQADSLSTEPEYLTIVELLQSESSFIVAPGDDWGLQGYFSNYGLPAYTVPVSYNGLPISDLLLGAFPFAWLNTRQNRVSVNQIQPAIEMTPVFADSGKNLSRFDYYQGDYGFLDFSLLLGGNIAEKINWRLFAENLGYDGGYGLLGPNPNLAVLRESIAQNYFLDVWKSRGHWTYELGSSYQKFQPGINNPTAVGFIKNLTYLTWPHTGHTGRLREYRTNFYAQGTAAKTNGIFKIGIQLTNTYYNVYRSPSIYRYTADGSQASLAIKRSYTFPTSSLTLSVTPTVNILSIRNTENLEQKWSRQTIEYTKCGRAIHLLCQLGSVNQHPIGNFSTSLHCGNYCQLSVHSQLDYYLYPLSYLTEIGGAIKNEVSESGFSAWQHQATGQFETARQKIQFTFAYTSSDFVMPHISSLEDTTVTFNRQSLAAPFLKGEYNFQCPWQMTLSGRAIYSPRSYGEKEATFQGWGRLAQALTLFHNNLNLYAAGDIYYLSCPNSLVWLEQLRTIGTSDLPYFTDERLSFGIAAGARIGTFHIFYRIYNVEGRTFATLPGMLDHNCLKIFGIDWTFIN